MAVVLGLLATAGCCFLAAGEVEKQDNGNGAFSSSSSSGGEDGGGSKKNHTVVVVVLVTLTAVVVFSALLLLLLRWLLLKRGRGRRSRDGDGGGGAGGVEDGTALQRQLQQLFHLHDAGLDQDVIDALPVFTYREVAKEPFDCAVCLCEFAAEDRLRLLPPCGHAFHVDCIDTWLLSNSTCPLCRCALGADAVLLDAFGFGGGEVDGPGGWKHSEDAAAVIPVRLGKFKSTAAGPVAGGEGIVTREAGETSSSSLDARRCYSMGSYQYVLAEASLQVSVHRRNDRAAAAAAARARGAANPEPAAEREGKRIGAGSKGDSFSVSKIWQWPRNGKGKLPVLASDDSPSVNGGRMPWHRRSPGDS